MIQEGEIILYQPNETLRINVRLEDETVWLTQQQMASLFCVKEHTITYHIKEIYASEELDIPSTTRKIRVVRKEGSRNVNRQIDFYNLEMIMSVGYRVNSRQGIQFRRWATEILKEYLLKGYTVNQRLLSLEQKFVDKLNIHDQKIDELSKKVDFFVRSSLPPVEGIFYNGQIFDAYIFASKLIRSAKEEVILIDNYIDETVLSLLDKREEKVKATIYTAKKTPQLNLDIKRHNQQFQAINIVRFDLSHDRFLIIDDDVYHIGASLKDLGKKWFAFSKLQSIKKQTLINQIQDDNRI